MPNGRRGSWQNPISPEDRGVLMVLCPVSIAFGVYFMATGRIGRGPMPIERWPAVALGALIAGFGGIVFGLAWMAQRRPRG